MGKLGIITGIIVIGISIMVVVTTIVGLVLSFSASILLGIITTIFLPCNFVIGLCWWFGVNVPEAVQTWINFPI